MENKNQFIEVRDLIGKNILDAIKKDKARKLISGRFDIGTKRRIADAIARRATKKNIVRVICVVNAIIPCTAWPVTNPIIVKVSKKIFKKKIVQKITITKMRFNLQ